VQNVYESGSPYTAAGRWGDYSGTNNDPAEAGVFWGIHEFVESGNVWQTFIAKYELSETVVPNAVTVETGSLVSGDASSIETSDDVRLNVLAAVSDPPTTEPKVSVLCLGNAVDTEFNTLKIQLEGLANSPNLLQSIEIFDHFANDFEEVEMQDIELEEGQIEVVLTDNPTRFVTPGSGQIITRLNFQPQGPVILFPWSIGIDKLNWVLENLTMLRALPGRDDWLFVPYESFVRRTEEITRQLATELNLSGVENMLEQAGLPSRSTRVLQSTLESSENAAERLGKWRSHVSTGEEERLMRILMMFDIDLYRIGSDVAHYDDMRSSTA